MKKRLTGKIISNKMQKTVVVRVESTREHPKYKRRYRLHKNYKAHVKNGRHPPTTPYQIGDKVIIEECRPISKEKGWKVVKKITTHIGEGSGEPFGSPV